MKSQPQKANIWLIQSGWTSWNGKKTRNEAQKAMLEAAYDLGYEAFLIDLLNEAEWFATETKRDRV